MFNLMQQVEAVTAASTPLKMKVRFVGGSKDGKETEAAFKVADESMLPLLDIRVTFGRETYRFNAADKTFVLESEDGYKEKDSNS
jgi:hypothetical protein